MGARLTVHTNSDWVKVHQGMIDEFAMITADDQWIHRRDVGRRMRPFGSPIAHGLLLLSLAISLARNSGALPRATWVLYGFDRLRFRAPVTSGTRIRCIVKDRRWRHLGGRQLLDISLAVEIENEKVPALTANCSLVCLDR